MPEVVTKDLMKVYRAGKSEVIALRGLEMAVEDGELVAIQGPSGCGKTSLLNLIGGIDRPTAGRVEVDGRNIVDLSDQELVRYRRTGVGFVFQFFNLVPTLTAQENVELPMRLASTPAAQRKERTKELLDLVGLADRRVHRPDELSGGEQQRIAIATALANDPPLILADEPTGELDTKTGQEILDLFGLLNRDLGKTIIVVTHDARVADIARR
ncbi:MAG: ABC transporter ATP-binding protein, partial [bacterium]